MRNGCESGWVTKSNNNNGRKRNIKTDSPKKEPAKKVPAIITGTEKQVQFEVPKGYKLVREPKTARMQLLVREDTKAAVKRAADACGVSLNEMANRILDAWADEQPDAEG